MSIFTEPFRARSWRETLHALLLLPLGIAGFTLVVTGVSVGGGLVMTFVGVPLLWATLLVAGGAASVERRLAKGLAGIDIPTPPRRAATGPGLWRRMLARLRDGASWREATFLVLELATGVATFTAAVVAWTVPLSLLSVPIWGPFTDSDVSWAGWHLDTPWAYGLSVALGLVLLPLAPWIVRGVLGAHLALARALLGPARTT